MTTSRSKAIGSAAERIVAAALHGERVGMNGGPVDVLVDGYLEAIPKGDRLRACVVVTRPGQGHKAIRTITFDLDEFSSWHVR